MKENMSNKINEHKANYAVKSNVIQKKAEVKENYIAGLVGAFLFSLAGGAVWYLLYQVGFIAGISGLIGVVCAIKGYAVFGKKESVKGVVTAVIVSVLVMVLAWYLCLATDVYKVHKDWYADGDIYYMPSFGECVRYAYTFLEDPEVASGYFRDLAIGLVFCIIGGFGSVRQAISRAKHENDVEIIVDNAVPAEVPVETAIAASAEAPAETEAE